MEELIVDTRFQSFYKCFIIDILNADASRFNDYKVVKIKNLFVSKVCVTGMILAIYELPKMFRCKIDDATGKINVTIWKDNVYRPPDDTRVQYQAVNDTNSNDTIFGDDAVDDEMPKNELQSLLNAIKSRTNDSSINNSIINRPVQGDLVTVRGYVKSYRNLFEINSISCTKLRNSYEEHADMILPIILHDKCYQLNKPTKESLEKQQLQQQQSLKETNEFNNNKENNSIMIDEKFLQILLSKLNQLTSSSRQACNSYSLYSNIRDNFNDYKQITHKNVIDALKQLEIKCLIYSCDNDNTYLPIN